MADINQASQELAEVLQRVTEEMRQFGRVSEETEAALRAGSFKRARDLDAAGKLTANALSDVAGAGLAAAKSLYAGQQGATQFNSALDGMAKAATAAGAALTFMMPGGFLVKALVGLGTAATVTAVEMTKAANEMANKLFDANVKMARSGAAASDGLTGLFNDAKKLGLSMNQLGVYADVVSGNAAELALFRGSVFEGRKAFANIGKSMQPFREQLEAAGIQLEDQIQGTAGYLRLQTQIGMSQNMTTQQLAMGARQYLIEMDGLAKLTGQQRQDIEKQMEAARNEQRFRAKLDAMRASGDAKQIAAADRLERANILIAKQSPELAQAFRDSASGVLSSDVAVKGMIGTNGELLRVTQQLTEGQMTEYQAFQNLGRAAGQFAKDMNFTAQLGLLNDFSIDYAQSMRIGIAAQRDVAVLAREIETEQRRQLGKENDVLAQELARMREATRQNNERAEKQIFDQIQSSLALGNRMNNVMTPLLDAFEKLTPLINRLRDSLTKLLDFLVPKLNAAVDKLNRLFPSEPGNTTLSERVANEGMFSAVGGGLGGYLGLKKGLASGAALGMRAPVYHPAAKLGTTVLGGIAGAAVGAFTGMTLGEFLDSYIGSNKPQPGGSTDAVDYGLVDPNLPTRAAGGPVTGKQPYLVGERGPELYVPEQSGNIVNNDKLSQILKDLTSSAFQNRQKFNQIGKTLGTDFQIVSTNSRKVAVDSKELMTDYSAVVQAVEEFKNLNQQNAQLTRDFADQYRIYIERCSDILRYSLQQMEAEGPPGAAVAMTAGQGIVPKAASGPIPGFASAAAPSGTVSGQGIQPRNQDDLAKLGLRIKRGDVHTEGAKISPKLLELAQQIQQTIPEFNVFTGFNDLFHQERHPRSAHTRGLAMDFTLAKPPTKEAGQDIVDYLKSLGFSYVADEYNRPNQFTTGGHFHAQLSEFAEGGITQGPTIAGEKGPEAVIPLSNSRVIPVKIIDNLLPDLSRTMTEQLKDVSTSLPDTESFTAMMQDIKTSLTDSFTQLLQIMERKTNTASEQLIPLLENLVRNGQDQVDVQTKILQTSY